MLTSTKLARVICRPNLASHECFLARRPVVRRAPCLWTAFVCVRPPACLACAAGRVSIRGLASSRSGRLHSASALPLVESDGAWALTDGTPIGDGWTVQVAVLFPCVDHPPMSTLAFVVRRSMPLGPARCHAARTVGRATAPATAATHGLRANVAAASQVRRMSAWKFWKKDSPDQQQQQQQPPQSVASSASSRDPSKIIDIPNTIGSAAAPSTATAAAAAAASSSSPSSSSSTLDPALRARLLDPAFRRSVFATLASSGKLDDPRVAMLTSRPQMAQEMSKACAMFAGMFSQQFLGEAQKMGGALPASMLHHLTNKAQVEAILKDEAITLPWLEGFVETAKAEQAKKANK